LRGTYLLRTWRNWRGRVLERHIISEKLVALERHIITEELVALERQNFRGA
jgi:hypothetical protein